MMLYVHHNCLLDRFEDFIDDGPFFYLVTELVLGGELFDQIVRRRHYSEGSARKLIVQILQALEYLHDEKGVIHRDIKPENILVTSGTLRGYSNNDLTFTTGRRR